MYLGSTSHYITCCDRYPFSNCAPSLRIGLLILYIGVLLFQLNPVVSVWHISVSCKRYRPVSIHWCLTTVTSLIWLFSATVMERVSLKLNVGTKCGMLNSALTIDHLRNFQCLTATCGKRHVTTAR